MLSVVKVHHSRNWAGFSRLGQHEIDALAVLVALAADQQGVRLGP